MQFVDEKNIPGLLLLIDFKKSYDSLSWPFMKNELKSFNFGPPIIKVISTFYNRTQVAINQGGNLSSFINPKRGCKQGDPISQYLFILCAEILEIITKNNKKTTKKKKKKNNNNNKGIKINNKAFILTQYSDATSVIPDGSEESLNETLSKLENYAQFSGLKVDFS